MAFFLSLFTISSSLKTLVFKGVFNGACPTQKAVIGNGSSNSRVRLGLTRMYKSDSECPNVCLPGLVACWWEKKRGLRHYCYRNFSNGFCVYKLLVYVISCINMALVLGAY